MRRTFLAACAAALLIGACSKGPTRPIVDGYTLHGVVTARDGTPLRDVSVLLGWEGSSEFHPFAMTGDEGTFLFKPAPNTGPSTELFRFEKLGFAAREVLARTATRLEPYRYRLEVELDPEPAPATALAGSREEASRWTHRGASRHRSAYVGRLVGANGR